MQQAIEDGSFGDLVQQKLQDQETIESKLTAEGSSMPLKASPSSFPARLRQRALDEVDSRFPMMATVKYAADAGGSSSASSSSPSAKQLAVFNVTLGSLIVVVLVTIMALVRC